VATRLDYVRQATGYDETRRASPSIVVPLAAALDASRTLVDVGGGSTGNYAVALRARGCTPTVVDLAPALRARTSYFERLAARDPDELAHGLERLARDLLRGRRPDVEVAAARVRYGDGAIVAWRKPG